MLDLGLQLLRVQCCCVFAWLPHAWTVCRVFGTGLGCFGFGTWERFARCACMCRCVCRVVFVVVVVATARVLRV